MTNTLKPKMVGEQDVDGPLLQLITSPIKSKPKSVRSSPRGKCLQETNREWEKNRVRPVSCTSPRGSPNGKSRRNPSKSPRQSPTQAELYAGFSDSPDPAALPRPPSHWMNTVHLMTGSQTCRGATVSFANNIKFLLKAQA